ncbi:subclass B1 metallo-beta-lactamase [Hyunsoonleella sp. SJ7]|uniref:beta-lactamase n=1 Tax=Hyunsoonleella aquatilis TaxID=2762758 RepID=A0A923KHU6_9FLAO|nr:subclass B1 metallo-beta-lactamase [Hyunsoonleella aquatilis]MBC3757374.1 subclass B1 metallo-beta-lactamase [Hyunsoonleella aquatilis]
MRTFIALFLLFFLISCKSAPKHIQSFESDILKIEKINDNIFRHISYIQTNDFGKVACNGMVYFNEDEAIVFDTPVDDEASKVLIEWITKTYRKKIMAVVITHFHNDCLGGLNEFHKNNISSHANEQTIILAKNDSAVLPKIGFKNKLELKVGNQIAITKHFGEGHTVDNVVGYIPNEKTLFGGCLIKSLKAGKGYLGDANTSEWSNTVALIKETYPNLKIVIPGHGKSGEPELLDYTVQLFKP